MTITTTDVEKYLIGGKIEVKYGESMAIISTVQDKESKVTYVPRSNGVRRL